MAMQNGLGVTSYRSPADTTRFVEGQVCNLGLAKFRTYRNPLLPQISTITITGFGADADSIALSITRPDGVVVSGASLTVTRAASVPVDDAAAAAALVLLVNAHASLNGHVVASSALGVVTLTFDHPGLTYTVATTVVACVATVATSQTAGGSAFPLGRFTAAGTSVDGQPALRALTASDTAAAIAGVVVRPEFQYANAGSVLASDVDSVPIGELASVIYEDCVAMRNNGSAAASAGGTVYAVVATTGGDEIGEARSDTSGVAQVITLTPGAGQNSVAVSVVITVTAGEHVGKSLFLSTTADGSMTATEVCDAWRVIINADAFWSTILVDSGTATLIITAADSSIGLDAVQANGTVTVDVATTARAPYAIPLDTSRFYWAEAVAAGAVGRVMCRC